MTDKQIKQAAVVALLIWWFWPSPAQAEIVTTDWRVTDPEFPAGSWRDWVTF